MSVSLDNSNDNLGVVVIDSMTINTSTYQLLNLPSTGTGSFLVGKSTQAESGSITSSSYFRVQLQTLINDIPANAAFDSINLVVRPSSNKYFYGDTTKTQTISVHRVTEEIVLKDITNSIEPYNTPIYVTGPTIFNDKKFTFDSTPLGVHSFVPRVNSLDSISIKLDHAFGQEIYDMVKANDYNVTTNESFQQYLKGLVLTPGNQNTAILGLNDTVQVNVNYSYMGSDGFMKKGAKVITSSHKAFQYNNIEYDRTGTAYASIDAVNRELKSAATNGEVLLQAGSGLVAKINIPSLNDFMHEENLAINKVELIVETKGHNYGYYPVPNALMLLIANSNGVPISYVRAPFATTIQQATFIPGNDSGTNGRYIFNLIDYTKNINQSDYRGTSLLLSVASPALFGTVNNTIIATENGKPKIKLNIVYTKFK
ncbi:DUF4270 family protein [Sphingobacterium paucimobilis]|uniref:DUF4270 domain-containing protein n=1 Tax=Sphingobacterium paucimobilis HER1398 TaxID=1346330 RepID=U2IYL2_9SPHI|nr:DUF4270 family protein [Sphingobacterium paucimobilis]ERJ57804.1 hypothetical protein M472_03400 [Sphingobacterium paucimobilis HER1398]ERJ60255.1 hypothetical protein M472_15970 [Sphingobacterium paucimobilis HER1398]